MANKNDRIVLWIKKDVLSEFVLSAEHFFPLETGGVLIGYWGNDTTVVITQSIGPGPKASHKLDSFSPDHQYQVKEIERAYNDSGRIDTYLGDWHVHPNTGSYLSDTDKKTLKRIAGFRPARLKQPLMIVLGTRPTELRAWSHTGTTAPGSGSIDECYIRFFD